MKKFLSILSAAVVTLSLCICAGISVGAATSAFSGELKTGPQTECHDAGGEKQMGWAEDTAKGECFGIGNTEPGDYVVFRAVDFGTTGASKATIRFSFLVTDYSPLPCTMELYIDSVTGTPAASFEIEDTGHWIEDASMNFSSDCKIAGGVHDVYVKWKNNTGSLFGVSFTKASGGNTTATSAQKTSSTTAATSSKPAAANTTVTSENASGQQTVASATDAADSEIAESREDSSAAEVNSAAAETSSTIPAGTEPEAKPIGPMVIVFVVVALVVAGGIVALVFINKKKA